MHDLTRQVQEVVSRGGVQVGTVHVFAIGSTAAIGVIEFEPGLQQDLPQILDRLMPPSREYGHEQTWHDGNGHSHLQATLLGPSLTVPIAAGKLLLGTWQQIFHLECDIHAPRPHRGRHGDGGTRLRACRVNDILRKSTITNLFLLDFVFVAGRRTPFFMPYFTSDTKNFCKATRSIAVRLPMISTAIAPTALPTRAINSAGHVLNHQQRGQGEDGVAGADAVGEMAGEGRHRT